MQGVGLRSTKWERLFRSENSDGLIFPILALCGDENGESLLGLEPADEDCIAAEAATLLPGCAPAIDISTGLFSCAMRQLSPAPVIGSQGESRKGITPLFRVGLLRRMRIGESRDGHAGLVDAHDARIRVE